MKIENWPIDKPIPYARNTRKISDAAVAKVAASIKEFGFRQPIVVDADGTVVAGHTRLLAARRLGLATVPVHVAANLTPAQIKAYRLMDNRSHEEAEWDLDLLPLELEDLKMLDFDLGLTGFDERELGKLLGAGTHPDEDVVAALPENPASKLGDLWLCGEHRVLCGDSTSPEGVARLLGDRKPFLMVCDPPHGIELDSEWRDRAGLNGCGPAEASYMKK